MKKLLLSLGLILMGFVGVGQASVPFSPFGGTFPAPLPTGLTTNTTSSYVTGAEGKMDATGQFYQLAYNAPGGVFTVKLLAKTSVATWAGTVDIQYSDDGTTWTSGQTVTTIGTNNSSIIGTITPPSTARFIRVFYTSKVANSNLGVDDIALASPPLPVTLISFKAILNERQQATLKWATASEFNNDFFEMERSKNATDFESLGKIVGRGTVQGQNDYTFTDEVPLKGINYYRLKQVDYDGQFSYSRLSSVIRDGDGTISLYPNPTVNTLKINFEDADQIENVTFYNTFGRAVKTIEGKQDKYEVTDLPVGKYILQFSLTDGRVIRNVFLKN